MANTKAQPELRKISIATVRSKKAAAVLVGKLRGAGIESFLVSEQSFSTGLGVRRSGAAIKIQVSSADIKRALQCLQLKSGAGESGATIGPTDAEPSMPTKGQSSGAPAHVLVPLGLACALALALGLLLLL